MVHTDWLMQVRVDAVTGQTVLGGMGKLHLEVIRDRILEVVVCVWVSICGCPCVGVHVGVHVGVFGSE